ncbi:kinase [Amycolatopsis sp. OK19-0408]|uniref:Kinase n=1 Tax=Amycolatopsis iheyensis TaxID=2945988 RepID=A0A9X2SPN8_9PSEU|nr:kinase [Amycolatopsis iheyensis]MCR6488366.1 kinase [Amycolatopsis iheyensis]
MATGSNKLHAETADTESIGRDAAAPAAAARPAAAGSQKPPNGPTGSPHTQLIVLRGPSGAGKSTVATAARAQLGRGVALVQQDVLRRVVLREHDVPGGLNIALIATVCRFSLDAGYHVILEGILTAARYGPMLRQLAADHHGRTTFFYFDVPFAETVRRHATRPQASEFTPKDMSDWYSASGRLDVPGEQIIAATSSADTSVARIVAYMTGNGSDASHA